MTFSGKQLHIRRAISSSRQPKYAKYRTVRVSLWMFCLFPVQLLYLCQAFCDCMSCCKVAQTIIERNNRPPSTVAAYFSP